MLIFREVNGISFYMFPIAVNVKEIESIMEFPVIMTINDKQAFVESEQEYDLQKDEVFLSGIKLQEGERMWALKMITEGYIIYNQHNRHIHFRSIVDYDYRIVTSVEMIILGESQTQLYTISISEFLRNESLFGWKIYTGGGEK